MAANIGDGVSGMFKQLPGFGDSFFLYILNRCAACNSLEHTMQMIRTAMTYGGKDI